MTQHDVHLAIDQSQGFSIACRNNNEKEDNSNTSKSCPLSGVWAVPNEHIDVLLD